MRNFSATGDLTFVAATPKQLFERRDRVAIEVWGYAFVEKWTRL
jgi:hypothetical protein